MNWMSRDIEKLKEYAKAHGLRVYFRKANRDDGSAEYVIGESITLCLKSRTSKRDIILSFLHELGHHWDLIRNGPDDIETNKAQKMLVAGTMCGFRRDITKKYRKLIYKQEFRGISYMDKIAKYLNLEIDIKEVEIQQKIDIYSYKIFLDEARFPAMSEVNQYKKEIKRGRIKRN